jgi:hypothetical protein
MVIFCILFLDFQNIGYAMNGDPPKGRPGESTSSPPCNCTAFQGDFSFNHTRTQLPDFIVMACRQVPPPIRD